MRRMGKEKIMGNEIITTGEGGLTTMSQSELVRIAAQAEERIDAIKKIKNTAIKLTNENDWVDQGGKPYLQVSGSEKIAGAFSISWSFLSAEPDYEEEEDGHYTYTYHGRFTMAGRSIEIDGSRSSKDPFFKEYHYPDGKNGKRVERTIHERTNKRDVKMSALTNLLGNGITRMLGIRNMSYPDLEEFAGIKKENLGKVSYGNKPAVRKTQSKSAAKPDKGQEGNWDNKKGEPPPVEVITTIGRITTKIGKHPHKILGEDDIIYTTYHDKPVGDAQKALDAGLKVKILHRGDQFNSIVSLTLLEEGQDG